MFGSKFSGLYRMPLSGDAVGARPVHQLRRAPVVVLLLRIRVGDLREVRERRTDPEVREVDERALRDHLHVGVRRLRPACRTRDRTSRSSRAPSSRRAGRDRSRSPSSRCSTARSMSGSAGSITPRSSPPPQRHRVHHRRRDRRGRRRDLRGGTGSCSCGRPNRSRRSAGLRAGRIELPDVEAIVEQHRLVALRPAGDAPRRRRRSAWSSRLLLEVHALHAAGEVDESCPSRCCTCTSAPCRRTTTNFASGESCALPLIFSRISLPRVRRRVDRRRRRCRRRPTSARSCSARASSRRRSCRPRDTLTVGIESSASCTSFFVAAK